MTTEAILKDLTTSSGYLANKSVFVGNINTQKLNGVALSTLQKEGDDNLAPTPFSSILNAASQAQRIDLNKNNEKHDYAFYKSNMDVEINGLPGTSSNPHFKNSAIGSKSGAVFGNQIDVLSANTNEKTVITPFTVSSNALLTDEIRMKSEGGEPTQKRIRLCDNVELDSEKIISFSGSTIDSITEISNGKVVTSQLGSETVPLKVVASGIEVDGDIEMGSTNKIITSQLQADDIGTLEIKADKVHFTANEISFDPDSTEITTGNFPQVIANLTDYENVQRATVYTYTDTSLKSDITNAIFSAVWRLQMFYNVIICKLKFNKITDETSYKEKIGGKNYSTLYLQFPSDYYAHFCDYYGKEDEDLYITTTELSFENDEETRKRRVHVYFNPKENNFLKLQSLDSEGKVAPWPTSFLGFTSLKIGQITFGLAVSTSRLKKQYQATTPSTFMKKPDFYETITPRKGIKIARTSSSSIYEDNITQAIAVTENLSSDYEMQAAVSATKIHRIAFFELRFSFLNKNSGQPVAFNDVLKVLKGCKSNPTQFLVNFIPNAETKKFASADQTNSDHIVIHPNCGVKFIYNPKAPLGTTKAIIDFSDATELNSEDDVAVSIQFYHITLN